MSLIFSDDFTALINVGAEPVKESCYNHNLTSNFIHDLDAGFVNNILQPSEKGPWIAGGACLSWYQNKPCESDIDVYFRNDKQAERFEAGLKYLIASHKGFIDPGYRTDNAITYKVICDNRSYQVQIIKKNFYKTAQDVISDFDITVCQIAWDGQRIFYGPNFVNDVKHKILRFDNMSPQSHKRLLKYMIYGYEPSNQQLKDLIASSNIDWDIKGNETYA